MRFLPLCSLSFLVLVAACATQPGEPADQTGTPQSTETPVPQPPAQGETAKDFVQNASYWGALYSQNSGNTEAALNYARNLRKLGSVDKAHSILVEAIARNQLVLPCAPSMAKPSW